MEPSIRRILVGGGQRVGARHAFKVLTKSHASLPQEPELKPLLIELHLFLIHVDFALRTACRAFLRAVIYFKRVKAEGSK